MPRWTRPPSPATRTVPSDGLDGLACGYRFSKTGFAETSQDAVPREALEKQEAWSG